MKFLLYSFTFQIQLYCKITTVHCIFSVRLLANKYILVKSSKAPISMTQCVQRVSSLLSINQSHNGPV